MVNREQPATSPVAPMGDLAVIVHLVWSDGLEEWRPARAVRWTRTHVMVGWRPDPSVDAQRGPDEQWMWLRASGMCMCSVSWLVHPDRTPARGTTR